MESGWIWRIWKQAICTWHSRHNKLQSISLNKGSIIGWRPQTMEYIFIIDRSLHKNALFSLCIIRISRVKPVTYLTETIIALVLLHKSNTVSWWESEIETWINWEFAENSSSLWHSTDIRCTIHMSGHLHAGIHSTYT